MNGSPLYDALLDGLADVVAMVARAPALYAGLDLLIGYDRAVSRAWQAGSLTLREFRDLSATLDEMTFCTGRADLHRLG